MDKCPKCASRQVHRSRTRGGFERLRRNLTGKAPFRCPDCGWRGWAFDFGRTHHAAEEQMAPQSEPDLREIDRELAAARQARQSG